MFEKSGVRDKRTSSCAGNNFDSINVYMNNSPTSSAIVSTSGTGSLSGSGHSVMDLGSSTHMVLMLSPRGHGSFREQAVEVLSSVISLLQKQPRSMTVTVQTIFLRDYRDRAECEQILASCYGPELPVTNFVTQPPCSGAALAMEVWAIGGNSLSIERYDANTLAVLFDDIRLVYCAGIEHASSANGAYAQSLAAIKSMYDTLTRADSLPVQIIRTWFFLGGITEPDELGGGKERYREFNRARAKIYRDVRFSHNAYPSSTGIGMEGVGLVASCITLETPRKDVFVMPLENPDQMPAYNYPSEYSIKSPKFSRAMALVTGDCVTTWISGTASIVNLESRHLNDVEKQTLQTIDNIERLISPENFAAHGLNGAGAYLKDFAQIRVYLKRHEDFERCKALCEQRFGRVPAIYTIADICRPELLVEIEGVTFSRYQK